MDLKHSQVLQMVTQITDNYAIWYCMYVYISKTHSVQLNEGFNCISTVAQITSRLPAILVITKSLPSYKIL